MKSMQMRKLLIRWKRPQRIQRKRDFRRTRITNNDEGRRG